MNVYLPYTAILPSEYQEVEYIESSGTQFIDTGYLITPTTEVSIDYQYINANNQDFAFGVGSDTNTSSGMTFCSYIGTTGGVGYFKAGLSDGTGSSTFTNNGPGDDTNRHKFILNNGHFLTYNSSGTLQKDVTTSATFTRTATHSFGLFCWWRTDTSARDNKTSAKLYGCEVKDNGVLQRHFVPCYRKSDNVIGLYDLVNNQFYTNSGTGTFSKGNDVTMSVLKNAYIGEYVEAIYTPTSGLSSIAKNGYKIQKAVIEWECTYSGSSGVSFSVRLTNSTSSVTKDYGIWIFMGTAYGNSVDSSIGGNYGGIMCRNPSSNYYHSFTSGSASSTKSAGILTFDAIDGNVKVGQTNGNWLYITSWNNGTNEASMISSIFSSNDVGLYLRQESGITVSINKVTIVYEKI